MRSKEIGDIVRYTVAQDSPYAREVQYPLSEIVAAKDTGIAKISGYDDAQQIILRRVEALLPDDQFEIEGFDIYEILRERKGDFVEIGSPTKSYELIDFNDVKAKTGKRIRLTNLPQEQLLPGIVEQIGDLVLDERVDIMDMPFEVGSLGGLFASRIPLGPRYHLIEGVSSILEPGGLFVHQGFSTDDLALTLGQGLDLLAYRRGATFPDFYGRDYTWTAVFQK